MYETPEGDGEHLQCHSSEITGFCDYHWPVVIIQCGCATVKKMQRYFKCLYAHGISLSSSRPPWSPIPPAARRTPEPASRSLPSPFDQVSPGDVDDNEQLLTEDQLSQNIFTHSITARQDMDVFRIDLMKMFFDGG